MISQILANKIYSKFETFLTIFQRHAHLFLSVSEFVSETFIKTKILYQLKI